MSSLSKQREVVETVGSSPIPRLRGRLHQAACLVSVPAGIVLVALARGREASLAAAIFATSVTAVLGTSAAYHRGDWSPRGRQVMQRVDHSMIFLLIAGTYTPVTLLALHPAWGVPVLAAVWCGGVAGAVLQATVFERMRRLGLVLYLTLGWLALVATPEIMRGLSPAEIGLLLAGGLGYTLGAAMFANAWPRLWPTVFGYHEVWHVMVVAGGVCHYVVVFMIVSG
jgi:hemolysin III